MLVPKKPALRGHTYVGAKDTVNTPASRTKRTEEDIRADIADAQALCKRLQIELHEVRMGVAGVRPGDIVRTPFQGKSVELKVTLVNTTRPYGRPWVSGVLRKKDGAWGVREWNVYNDWTKIS